MTLKVKKFKVGEHTYQIKQHPAIEGCQLLETYHNAINAFCSVTRAKNFKASNRHIIPFAVELDKRWLGLLMFVDKLECPASKLDEWRTTSTSFVDANRLTVKEIKEGKTLADRESQQEDSQDMPLSVAINYQATDKQEATVDVDAILGQFLRYVTLDGEDIVLDELSHTDMAEILAYVLVHNFLHIWDKQRFALPQNYSTGHETPSSVVRARGVYSQPNVIYTILQSKLNLASYTDLATMLSTEDAFEMNEAALLAYYEEAEAQKEAERQAKTTSKG